MFEPTSLELCAGGGGQALGLESAGFEHAGLIENDAAACNTLRLNRPGWNVLERDLFQSFDFSVFKGIDLLAGGLPCPPFSIAGKQLGEQDERNLFTRGVEIVDEIRPRAVMFENVRGMLGPSFQEYRARIQNWLEAMGYCVQWSLFQASDFGVPQLRPRVIMTAVKNEYAENLDLSFERIEPPTVGRALKDLMGAKGWAEAELWASGADTIAPTIVGGSKKHGGPDLGPTRARSAWRKLGVNGGSIAEEAPEPGFSGLPRLTLRMVARIQGFPDSWGIWGGKTAAYRQVGNAFPPPVAAAVAGRLRQAIASSSKSQISLDSKVA